MLNTLLGHELGLHPAAEAGLCGDTPGRWPAFILDYVAVDSDAAVGANYGAKSAAGAIV
jgi:hypothetical protein